MTRPERMTRDQLIVRRTLLLRLYQNDDGTHELQHENLPLDIAEVDRLLAAAPPEKPPLASRYKPRHGRIERRVD